MDIEKPLAISNSVYILYLNNLTVLQKFFQDIEKLPNLFFIMSTTKQFDIPLSRNLSFDFFLFYSLYDYGDEDHRWVLSTEIAIMKIFYFERIGLMR